MTMSSSTWKYVGSATPLSNLPSDVLDALYTLGTSITYYDASARTPGSGVAGTWERKRVAGLTEAVYCTPASDTHTIRHIIAGSAAARTPTMISSPRTDTWATNTLLYGISRGGSTFNVTGNGWDQALPFTSGAFTGYGRALALGSFTIAKVHLFECATGWWIVWATTTSVVHTWGGELIDPGVTYATSPTNAEQTTGGRYAMWMSGSSSATSTTSWSGAASGSVGVMFGTSISANSTHFYLLSVGGVALTEVNRAYNLEAPAGTTSFLNSDGDMIPMEIHVVANASNVYVGRVREMRIGPDSKVGYTASKSGVVKAYAASTHVTTDNDTCWLLA